MVKRLGVLLVPLVVVLGLPADPAVAAGPPVISTFSPAIAAPGDSVVLTVSNVDPTAVSTPVTINGVTAPISAKTTTSVTITVPSGVGGGKVVLTAPAGTATSANDLFVVPSGTAVTDVAGTGRIVTGTKSTLSVPAGKTAEQLFDVNAGDRIAVSIANASPSSCLFTIKAWDTTLAQAGSLSNCIGTSGWVDTMAPATAGTRTLTVTNYATSAGSLDVTLTAVPADVNFGTLALDGSTSTVSIASPGQNGSFTFTGSAGQRVAVQSSSASANLAYSNVSWGLYAPDGTNLGGSRYSNSYLDTTSLPTAGTYKLVVDPFSNNTGSLAFTAWTVPADLALGAMPLDGSAKTVAIANPGQNGYLTFSGTAGQRLALQSSSATGGLVWSNVSWGLYAPDGTNVGGTKFGNSYLDAVTLPATGTYQILVDPYGSNTGSVTFNAYVVPADANLGVMPLDGSAKTVTLATPGQNGYLTFSGTAGQRIAAQAGGSTGGLTFGNVTWSLLAPDGSNLSGSKLGNTYLDTVILPATGTYQLYVDPASSSVGSITFNAYVVPADLALGTLPIDGSTKTVTLSNPGQNGYLTFAGTAGTPITFTTTNAAAPFVCCFLTWTAKGPDGSTLGSQYGNGTLTVTPTTTGTQTLYLDPADVRTGSITVSGR